MSNRFDELHCFMVCVFACREELGKNINADEAAAMGAVYQAAVLSKAFKVKPFLVRDAAIFPIQVGSSMTLLQSSRLGYAVS